LVKIKNIAKILLAQDSNLRPLKRQFNERREFWGLIIAFFPFVFRTARVSFS